MFKRELRDGFERMVSACYPQGLSVDARLALLRAYVGGAIVALHQFDNVGLCHRAKRDAVRWALE